MARQYFSQWGQDKWAAKDVFDFEECRYFLELGASDGIYYSNTYFLEKYLNWKGICIEANNQTFKKLKENRACICVHACVDNTRQKVMFTSNDSQPFSHQSLGSYLTGGIIDDDVKNKIQKNRNFVWKQTVTLEEVLEKNNAPNIIDFFSLDVQGAETRIMKDFPFDRYIFLSMCIERPGRLLRSILKKNGYLEVRSNPFDKLYLHKSLFKTFSIRKKCIVYCFYIFSFFDIRNIRKIRRILYYTRHIGEIPAMIRRKFL